MSERTLNQRDYRVLRDILDLTRPDHPDPPQERVFQLLAHLAVLTGCDTVSLQDTDCIHEIRPYCQALDEGVRIIEPPETTADRSQDPEVRLFWQCWWTSVCSLPERTGTPVVVSDRSVLSQREMRSHPLYVEYLTYVDEILLGYPTGPGRSARLLLSREEGSAFGHRELVLMQMLSPHLEGLVRATVPPATSRTDVLTGRQLQILRQVAQGLTNRDVGRALGISEATVRKHLEHSYQRLGVLSRAEAVAELWGESSVGLTLSRR